MNRLLIALITSSLVAGAATASSEAPMATTKRAAIAEWSVGGMKQIEVPGLDVVYLRPGAELSAYRKILVSPVPVAFRRDWERNSANALGSRIQPKDTQRIRDELSQVVHDEIVRELARSGYGLTDAPGPDVLEINVRVAELYLNAPNLPTAALTQTYTYSFGELTLVAELRDSGSGETVMRILDKTEGANLRQLRITTRVENAVEVGRAANAWARAVRRELDLAKGISRK